MDYEKMRHDRERGGLLGAVENSVNLESLAAKSCEPPRHRIPKLPELEMTRQHTIQRLNLLSQAVELMRMGDPTMAQVCELLDVLRELGYRP